MVMISVFWIREVDSIKLLNCINWDAGRDAFQEMVLVLGTRVTLEFNYLVSGFA